MSIIKTAENDAKKKHFAKKFPICFLSGIINGLLGAGGGMLIVPTLKRELNARSAHATTVAIILPMSIASSISYLNRGRVRISDVMPYAPFGVIGTAVGAILLTRLRSKHLRIVFSLFMIWAGIRMITG